ncbi:MAG TPA: hypothetical protein VGR73_22675 [Bryobacteraceae bacterium]|nr:hypothetical protein [Bryobacteraceae bacterium]
MKRFTLVLIAAAVFPLCAAAQDSAEVLSRMKALEDRIQALEQEIQVLKGQPPAVSAAAPAPQPAPAEAPQVAAQSTSVLGGAGGAASKVLNPDVAVIGDFLGAAGNSAGHPTPALEMHESEAAFQAILDPYARADFFLSFGEEGVTLEEGYLTFPALKGGFQLRVGKMRAAFGKVNTLHNHVLPWADRPLVTGNLVGGEDGIDDAGLSLTRIIPAPKGLFLEGTAQVFRGDSGDLFHSYKRDNLSTVGHLRAYRDIGESTNLDLGVSYSRGHSAIAADVIDQLYGMDATVRWKPLRRAIYHSFVGRSEVIWSRLEQASRTATPFGYYVSGEYQFARRWFAGARFDRSDRLGSTAVDASGNLLVNSAILNAALLQDTGGSFVLTYWPSEFSQIRGQLRRTSYGENRTANEFLFQFQFSIGAHGAHPF